MQLVCTEVGLERLGYEELVEEEVKLVVKLELEDQSIESNKGVESAKLHGELGPSGGGRGNRNLNSPARCVQLQTTPGRIPTLLGGELVSHVDEQKKTRARQSIVLGRVELSPSPKDPPFDAP
jgi:hypothetical protein